jgi:phosphoserine phosphatase RsbX
MTERGGVVEWSVAARPMAGEQQSGDAALVLAAGREALVAAIDGVGHGSAAERAAEVAVNALRAGPWSDVVALVESCHAALRPTRGAAVGLAVFRDDGTARWLGVGNVAGYVVPGGQPSPSGGRWLMSQSGVVGDELPTLSPATLPLRRGDVLVLATDGIDSAFADDLVATGSCEEIAGRVLNTYARTSDDALVVAARYLGENSA